FNRNPVFIANGKPSFVQIRIIAYDNAVFAGVDFDDVLRISGGDQPFTLSDRIVVNSVMCPNNVPVDSYDFAWLFFGDIGVLLNKFGVRAALYEADFLRLRFIVRR